jgi:hypothetical protein
MHPIPVFIQGLLSTFLLLLVCCHMLISYFLPVCDSHPAVYSPAYPGLLSPAYLPTSLLASVILSTSFPLVRYLAAPNHAPLSSAYLILPVCSPTFPSLLSPACPPPACLLLAPVILFTSFPLVQYSAALNHASSALSVHSSPRPSS